MEDQGRDRVQKGRVPQVADTGEKRKTETECRARGGGSRWTQMHRKRQT